MARQGQSGDPGRGADVSAATRLGEGVLAACGGDLRLAYRLLAHYAARALTDRSEGYVRTRPTGDGTGGASAPAKPFVKPWHRPDSLDPEPSGGEGV